MLRYFESFRGFDVSIFRGFDVLLNDELHFLEGIAALLSVVIAQQQVAVVRYVHNFSHEGTVFVGVGMESLPPVEHGAVLLLDVVIQIVV